MLADHIECSSQHSDQGAGRTVGVFDACSMAAALNGTPAQIENAAEIGMKHNPGLTCDPIAGLVQIPCIERTAKAVAARLALLGDVIAVTKQTGDDMKDLYKETSKGGLSVAFSRC